MRCSAAATLVTQSCLDACVHGAVHDWLAKGILRYSTNHERSIGQEGKEEGRQQDHEGPHGACHT